MSEHICPRCGMPVLPHDPQEIHGVNHYHQPYACCELLVAKLGHVNQQLNAAVTAIVYLTKNYGGKLHNSWYAEHPELGMLVAAEDKRWEDEP